MKSREKKTKKAGKCGRLFPMISPIPILHTQNNVAKKGRCTESCSPSQMCDV